MKCKITKQHFRLRYVCIPIGAELHSSSHFVSFFPVPVIASHAPTAASSDFLPLNYRAVITAYPVFLDRPGFFLAEPRAGLPAEFGF